MNASKIFYIPGWASGRRGEHSLVTKLRRSCETEVLWLPDMGDNDWRPSQPPEMIYTPRLIRKTDAEPEPVTLIGWSVGGMAAMELAAARPAHVKSLVLISTTAKFCSDEARPIGSSAADLDRMKADLLSSPHKALRRFFTMCCRPHTPDRIQLDRRLQEALNATTEQLVLGLDYLRMTDLRPILNRISSPALILHGDMDEVVPAGAAHELREHLPEPKLHILAEQGHLLPDNADHWALSHILDFLSLRRK